MILQHPKLGEIEVPDNFWDLNDSDKNALISQGITNATNANTNSSTTDGGSSSQPSGSDGIGDVLRDPDSTDDGSATSDIGDEGEDSDIKALAVNAAREGVAEFESIKDKFTNDDTLGNAGRETAKATKAVGSFINDRLSLLNDNMKKVQESRNKAVLSTLDWIVDNQDELLAEATDLTLLALIWLTPFVPPEVKLFSTLDSITAIYGLTGPKALVFVKAYAEELGHPLSDEAIASAQRSFTVGQNTPKSVIRKYFYKKLKERHTKPTEPKYGNKQSLLSSAPEDQPIGANRGGRATRLF